MKLITDLRVLKAIIKRTEYNTLLVNEKYKYIEIGHIVTPIKYKGKKYVTRYIDGCFYPYITELINNN